jgi:hypothetical protein
MTDDQPVPAAELGLDDLFDAYEQACDEGSAAWKSEWRRRIEAALAPAPTAPAGLREALTTALSVALHEALDPDCLGEPDYMKTAEVAANAVDAAMKVAAIASPSEEPGGTNGG